jgi:hypothetical protein
MGRLRCLGTKELVFFSLDLGESSRAIKFAGYDVSDLDGAERRSVVEQRRACKEFHLTSQVSMS